ncbi:MAG: rhodanese-like domain-containing protein [Alphaproteobacteria bacterium]|nr:rhodanese-like domain-containing protein [Alphaproteobacteria bacterium]MBF0372429.1 rhodanese-like domain-containing protein [Alphaproteobacteria bacterium]MBF0392291.1 rhodanese-like domain-containing protein [Alphaproteobacteria bacterium]
MRFLPTMFAAMMVAGPAQAGQDGKLAAPDAHEMARRGELVIVDIRQPEEWKATGVPEGAALISMRHPGGGQGFVDDLLKAAGGRDAPIGLICRTGNRTAMMTKALRDAGFTQVYDISEGMAGGPNGPGWINRKLPVTPCAAC